MAIAVDESGDVEMAVNALAQAVYAKKVVPCNPFDENSVGHSSRLGADGIEHRFL